jgi:hypothetical protein
VNHNLARETKRYTARPGKTKTDTGADTTTTTTTTRAKTAELT